MLKYFYLSRKVHIKSLIVIFLFISRCIFQVKYEYKPRLHILSTLNCYFDRIIILLYIIRLEYFSCYKVVFKIIISCLIYLVNFDGTKI